MAKGMTINTFTRPEFQAGVKRRFLKKLVMLNTTPDAMGRVMLHRLLGNVIKVDDRLYRDATDVFNGDLEEVGEGTEEAPLVSPELFANRQVSVKLYKTGYQVTEEALEDGDRVLGDLRKFVPRLADFAVLHRERNFVDTFFNRAFTHDPLRDQMRLSGDRSPLIGAGHMSSNGTLSSNTLGVYQALSEPAIADMLSAYAGMVDDGGQILALDATRWALVVPQALVPKARQIVGSTATLAAGASAGVRNLLDPWNITVISSPYLTDETAWFLVPLNSQDELGLDIIERKAPSIKQVVKEDPDLVKWIVSTRYALSAGNYRALAGTRAGG